jgi:ribose transport system ATP-binding protein
MVTAGSSRVAAASDGDGRAPIALTLRNVSKSFPGQRALDSVSLDFTGGEVHGLVGQNGSGKSTLIKILAGFHEPDSGAQATLDGEPFPLGSSSAADAAGLRFIHQDLGLIPTLNVIDNLALGRGYDGKWWVGLRDASAIAEEMLAEFGFEVDVRLPIAQLSPVERSMVAIVRALRTDTGAAPRILVLDEPTESLAKPDAERLFEAIRKAAATGAAVLYVSHRLDDVLSLADEISVLRDGKLVGTKRTDELDHDSLVRMIVGRRIDDLYPPQGQAVGDVALRASSLTGNSLENFSLDVRRGEIVGIAGLAGSGREELPYLLTGAQPWSSGSVEIRGKQMSSLSPSTALRSGIVLVAADRATQSAIPTMTTRENITLPRIDARGPARWIGLRRERRAAAEWMRRSDVRPVDPERPFAAFSGGNQQKAVLARAMRCEPSVLVLDEPVQGVDVGSRIAIFQQLLDAVGAGMAVIVSSTEAEDLAGLCDRVLVLRAGYVVAELQGPSLSVDSVVERSLAADTKGVAR